MWLMCYVWVDLAQDLLESVVEGPEGDAIFEIYEEVEEPLAEAATGKGKGRGQGKADAGAEVADEDMLEAMAMEIGDDFME
jgi:hypothetical protein